MSERNIKKFNLRIVPSNPVFEEVVGFKRQFINSYGSQTLARSKPHITLVSFEMDIRHQNLLLQAFDQLSNTLEFKLDIMGFGTLKDSLLYLKVSKTNEIRLLHRQIETLCHKDLNEKLMGFKISEKPHMTISTTTGRKMSTTSLSFFKRTDYVRRINVNHLTLVSRYKDKTWDWEHQIKLALNQQLSLHL